MKRLLTAAFALLLATASAFAQFPGSGQTPTTVPNNTVMCNSSGATANPAACTAFTLQGIITFIAPAASSGVATGISDQTATIASEAAFWTGYGTSGATPGNPVIHRFNRIMVGEVSTKSGACHSGSMSWIQTLFGANCESANIVVSSTLGTNALTASARTSDFRTWKGAASQGTSAMYLFGVGDDTGTGFPIMNTLNIEAVAMPSLNAASATFTGQFNVDNVCCNRITDPYLGVQISNLLLTPGGTPPSGFSSEFNVDSALYIGGTTGSGFPNTYFNHGIVFAYDSIATGAGPTVNGAASNVAISMASTHALVWFSSSGTASGAVYTGTALKLTLWARSDINIQANDGAGTIVMNPGGSGGISINNVAAVSCPSGINTGTFRSTNGIVTHC